MNKKTGSTYLRCNKQNPTNITASFAPVNITHLVLLTMCLTIFTTQEYFTSFLEQQKSKTVPCSNGSLKVCEVWVAVAGVIVDIHEITAQSRL